jgi:hypothetical protein
MRLSKSCTVVLFSVCLGYYAVLADAAPSRRVLADTPSALAGLGRMLPRLSVPATAVLTAREGMAKLREVVQASALMRDSRPDAEAARRAHVALWADLESGLRVAPEDARSGPSGLLPGQD